MTGVPGATAPPDLAVPSLGGTLAATFVVLAIIAAAAWLLRRGVIRFGPRRAPSRLAVETALSLGERRSLVIVSVEGRRLLLGLTPAQVSLVAELTPGTPAPAGFEQALDARTSSSSTSAS